MRNTPIDSTTVSRLIKESNLKSVGNASIREIKKLVDTCYENAKRELGKYKLKLKLLAETLLKKEVMSDEEVCRLLGLKKKRDISLGVNESFSNGKDQDKAIQT